MVGEEKKDGAGEIKVDSYTCSVCGGPVDPSPENIVDGAIKRPCGHDTAVVHANLSGTLRRAKVESQSSSVTM